MGKLKFTFYRGKKRSPIGLPGLNKLPRSIPGVSLNCPREPREGLRGLGLES